MVRCNIAKAGNARFPRPIAGNSPSHSYRTRSTHVEHLPCTVQAPIADGVTVMLNGAGRDKGQRVGGRARPILSMLLGKRADKGGLDDMARNGQRMGMRRPMKLL